MWDIQGKEWLSTGDRCEARLRVRSLQAVYVGIGSFTIMTYERQ